MSPNSWWLLAELCGHPHGLFNARMHTTGEEGREQNRKRGHTQEICAGAAVHYTLLHGGHIKMKKMCGVTRERERERERKEKVSFLLFRLWWQSPEVFVAWRFSQGFIASIDLLMTEFVWLKGRVISGSTWENKLWVGKVQRMISSLPFITDISCRFFVSTNVEKFVDGTTSALFNNACPKNDARASLDRIQEDLMDPRKKPLAKEQRQLEKKAQTSEWKMMIRPQDITRTTTKTKQQPQNCRMETNKESTFLFLSP